MNPLLHDVVFGAGLIFLGSIAIVGLFLIGAGAVTILSRRIDAIYALFLDRSGNAGARDRLRVVDGGDPFLPSTTLIPVDPLAVPQAANSSVRPALRRHPDKAGFRGTPSAANGATRVSFFDGGIA